MGNLRIIGSHLVSDKEYYGKQIDQSLLAHDSGTNGATVSLISGAQLDLTKAPPPVYTEADGTTPLPAIGFGQPMTVDIRYIYTGRVGAHDFFNGTGDIIVLSGVKDWGVFKASARALNYVAKGVQKHQTITGTSATTDGTPIVAYQKAVASSQVTVTLELEAAAKETGVVNQLGTAFTQAAGIPLLLPYAGYFLAAGQLLPIVGKIAAAIGGGSSGWSQNLPINFGLPGTVPSVAQFHLVTTNTDEFAGCTFDATNGVLRKDGSAYDGDEPYLVVAVYGGVRPELDSFAPTVATADLLNRTALATSGGSGILGDLDDIVKLASDMKFRNQALDLQRQIAAAAGDAATIAQLTPQLDAAKKNITDPSLRPQ